MLQGSISILHSLTHVILDLMLRLWKDSSHVLREWCQVKISKEMEIYRLFGGTFGFQMAIADRKTKMSGKLQ
jgi:hypothetical protein